MCRTDLVNQGDISRIFIVKLSCFLAAARVTYGNFMSLFFLIEKSCLNIDRTQVVCAVLSFFNKDSLFKAEITKKFQQYKLIFYYLELFEFNILYRK